MVDSITQSLFSLTLTLRAIRRSGGWAEGSAGPLFDTAEELARHSLAEMCALSFDMRPDARAKAGLAQALQTHVRSVEARSGLVIHMDLRGDSHSNAELEEALYQVVRFSLQNVVRRGKASEAWLELDLGAENPYICIRDNDLGSAEFRLQISELGLDTRD